MSTLTRATLVEAGYPQYGSVAGKYRGDRNLSIPDLEGKVLLALMDHRESRKILSGKVESFTPQTITDSSMLEKELQQVRERERAVDGEEITRGIMCVAAPVYNLEGDTAAAISLTFPSFINEDGGIDKEIDAVRRCSSAISDLWRKMKARIRAALLPDNKKIQKRCEVEGGERGRWLIQL